MCLGLIRRQMVNISSLLRFINIILCYRVLLKNAGFQFWFVLGSDPGLVPLWVRPGFVFSWSGSPMQNPDKPMKNPERTWNPHDKATKKWFFLRKKVILLNTVIAFHSTTILQYCLKGFISKISSNSTINNRHNVCTKNLRS